MFAFLLLTNACIFDWEVDKKCYKCWTDIMPEQTFVLDDKVCAVVYCQTELFGHSSFGRHLIICHLWPITKTQNFSFVFFCKTSRCLGRGWPKYLVTLLGTLWLMNGHKDIQYVDCWGNSHPQSSVTLCQESIFKISKCLSTQYTYFDTFVLERKC